MQVLAQPVALEPADRRLELGQRHLRPALVAGDPLQHSVVAMIEPGTRNAAAQSRAARLVLDRLCRHHLAQPRPQPPLDHGRRLQQLRLRLLPLRTPHRQVRTRLQRREAQCERVALERDDALLASPGSIQKGSGACVPGALGGRASVPCTHRIPRPSARSSVPESSRRTAAHSSSGRIARDQAPAASSPVLAASEAVSGSVSDRAGRW